MRILTYNIWNGGEGRLGLLADVVRAVDADAVALVEANSLRNAQELARGLGLELLHAEANSEFAIGWLTRGPLARGVNHRLPVLEKTLLEAEYGGVHLFATHLAAGRREEHETRRIAEVEAILAVLGRCAGPHVLVGDFNAVAPDEPIGDPPPEERVEHVARRPVALLLEAGYVDCYRAAHPEPAGWTYLSHHPWARLDFVFASPDLGRRLVDAGLRDDGTARIASDHLPVWAELDVP